MSGWQTIETLPQSGNVLAYFPKEKESRQTTVMQVRHGKPWIVGASFAFDLSAPTHWMPLPPPPEA